VGGNKKKKKKKKKKAFRLLGTSGNQRMAEEITSISESALRCLCKGAFLPEDMNISLIIESYFKDSRLHMWA